jgi:phosphatidylinositol 4-phosphatase
VVYAAKGIVDIPLVEDRAKMALKTLAARNKSGSTRPSSIPKIKERLSESVRPSVDLSKHDAELFKEGSVLSNLEAGRFILRPSSAQSSSSELSTSSVSSVTASPVFKTLAERLSFWSRLPQRPTASNEQRPLVAGHLTLAEEQEAFDRLTNGGREQPAQVMENILASTAPPPAMTEERHSQLEAKVVRECIREFTKGGMYFAYRFGIA